MNIRNKILFGVVGVLVVVGFVLGVYRQEIPVDIAEHIKSKSDLIVVDEPRPLSVITSPLTVRGQARGTWYFEASFPLDLLLNNLSTASPKFWPKDY